MKRVLVTGATGFIGRHALRPLVDRGYEVHALTRSGRTIDQTGNLAWHQLDLFDSNQVSKLLATVRPSHLLHFSWYAAPADYRTSLENLRWVSASIDLLRMFDASGGQRAVFAGTCFEYDSRFGFCSEALTPTSPSSLYGTCKKGLEGIVTSVGLNERLSTAWGRVFFLFGPHEYASRLVPSVILSLLRKEPVLCTHGKQTRDFMYVVDVADAFAALLDSDIRGPVNISSGLAVTLKDIVYLAANELDGSELVRLGALAASPDEPLMIVGNTRRLREEVGWQPRFSLKDGLLETISWWQDRERLRSSGGAGSVSKELR